MKILLVHMGQEHPLTLNGGVLVRKGGGSLSGGSLSGDLFRHLRDVGGATIRTDDPERVCEALDAPKGEPGILPL